MSDPSVPRLPAHASGTALPPPGRRGVAGWLGVPGVVLLPLRAFLGFTFTFAGAQKLANPNFFDARSPISIRAQMIASERVSPLHAVLGHLLQFSTLIGVLIALGELAVGIGTLLGIWTRLAALGGMVLSLTLFLTVSFHSTPYYTGADLVFLFAWTPLLVAGAGGAPALDTLVRQRVGRPGRTAPLDLAPDGPATTTTWAPPPETRVAPALGTVGRAVGVGTGVSGAGTAPVVDRRRLVLGGAAAAATGVVVAAAAGAAAGIGRLVGGAPPPRGGTVSLSPPTSHGAPGTSVPTTAPSSLPSTSPSTAAPSTTPSTTAPTGTAIGAASKVPIGGAASFTDPATGDPALVLQLTAGHFVAYDAVCPHAGCTVGYSTAARLLVCPCHGSEFDPTDGHVEVGPASRGLGHIGVTRGSDGQLYVTG